MRDRTVDPFFPPDPIPSPAVRACIPPRTAPSGRKEHPLAKGKSHSNREVKKPKQAKKPDLTKAGDPFAKVILAASSDKKKS